MSNRQTYKIDESHIKENSKLAARFSDLAFQLQELLWEMNKALPRRNQRFERSCDALTNKTYLVSQLWVGLTLSGELPNTKTPSIEKWG